jgi:hypothetical protein
MPLSGQRAAVRVAIPARAGMTARTVRGAAPPPQDMAIHAAGAVRYIQEQLPPGQQPVSISAVAALAAAAAIDEDR